MESIFLQNQSQKLSFDPCNEMEIKTKSVEATLLPLVTQISTLVNFKENIITGNKPKSERALRAALKIGTAVQAAVERFVVVGETIADENPDIQPEMYDACHEARLSGGAIANLHSSIIDESGQSTIGIDKSQLVKAARRLLSSVTRVLLLADRVLVKHVLRAKDKINYLLIKLENTTNFTEFVKIFTEFGNQMVELAHRSGDRQNDLKSEKRHAQMAVARSCLERMTMLLLTSSKTVLRHPDDQAAKQCRSGVFHQIRISLQLIGICVTDGILPYNPTQYSTNFYNVDTQSLDIGLQMTASVCIKQLTEMLEMVKMMSLVGNGVQERLITALDLLCEMTQDFTNSAFILHAQREQILDFLEECRFEMSNLVHPQSDIHENMRNEVIEVTVERLNRRLKDLRKQLQVVALDQVAAVFRANDDQSILSSIKTCAMSGDIDGVEKYLEKFREHAEHLQQVCSLLHHISMTDALHIYSGHAKRNLQSLAPMTLLAGRTLCIHPSSRIARENLEVFCDTWAANVNDLSRLAKNIDATVSSRVAAEKQAYMSLPRPGVSSNINKTNNSAKLLNFCGSFINENCVKNNSDVVFYNSFCNSSFVSFSNAKMTSNLLNNSLNSGKYDDDDNIITKKNNEFFYNKHFFNNTPNKKLSKDSGISSLIDSTINEYKIKKNGTSESIKSDIAFESENEVIYSTVKKPSLNNKKKTNNIDFLNKQFSLEDKVYCSLSNSLQEIHIKNFNNNQEKFNNLQEKTEFYKNFTNNAQDSKFFIKNLQNNPTLKAPLANCNEVYENDYFEIENNSFLRKNKEKDTKFKSRMSLILENLQNEAENLQILINKTKNPPSPASIVF